MNRPTHFNTLLRVQRDADRKGYNEKRLPHLYDVASLIRRVDFSSEVNLAYVRSGPVKGDVGVERQAAFLSGVER